MGKGLQDVPIVRVDNDGHTFFCPSYVAGSGCSGAGVSKGGSQPKSGSQGEEGMVLDSEAIVFGQ